MAYRRLGRTGFMISEVVMGGNTIAPENFEHVLLALDHGLNYLDTAPAYGQGKSERGYSHVIRARGRDKFFLTSSALLKLAKENDLGVIVMKAARPVYPSPTRPADPGRVQLVEQAVSGSWKLPQTVTLWAETDSPTSFADSLKASLNLNSATTPLEIDLSAVGAGLDLSRPVLESFTLPVLNPHAVWSRIKANLGFTDNQYDGVAIYQNFDTDIIFYAGAYSTVGNSGADGVGAGSSKYRKEPTLLHMNRIPSTFYEAGADAILNHEFGHHWLYFFQIMENRGIEI